MLRKFLFRNFLKKNGVLELSHFYSNFSHGELNIFGTMDEVKSKMMNRLGLDTGFNISPKSRDYLTQFEPKLEDLPPRSMQDSFTSAVIPFSTDKTLQDKYVTNLGSLRLGRLMEDMDMFAVWVCHQHVFIPNLNPSIHLPYTFVTILVDKIDFTAFIPKFDKDIRLSGHVSWIGRSSIEVVVWLEQLDDNGVIQKITRALFLMAARNASNTKAAPVNPLVPANEEEDKIFAGGIERKNRRIQLQSTSLLKSEPNDFEQKLIHDIFLRTLPKNQFSTHKRVLPPNCKWMKDHIISNVNMSFPENRNAHNKVFGGFLMKNALENSWVCACLYCGHRPRLHHICDISFQRPVDVSSFIKMSSHVVYTEKDYVQIMTTAEILNNDDTPSVSNVFYYTFKSATNVSEILPKSYRESIWYLLGRREFHYALGLKHE